ncbi:hypothetical protein ACH5RR_006756 [Cinchona calisaya]|uniref:Uncharacterized protein n=1 Tax=Cinchona calisaya TaxID=153742 RepID=A0ABD3APX9_9GENT
MNKPRTCTDFHCSPDPHKIVHAMICTRQLFSLNCMHSNPLQDCKVRISPSREFVKEELTLPTDSTPSRPREMMSISLRSISGLKKRKSVVGYFRITRKWRRRKSGLEMSESHCLETHWKRSRDFGGSLSKIFSKRSSLLAMEIADGEAMSGGMWSTWFISSSWFDFGLDDEEAEKRREICLGFQAGEFCSQGCNRGLGCIAAGKHFDVSLESREEGKL